MATMNYKCPNCGGPLMYNPDKQKFACEYCFSEFTDEQVQQLYREKEQQQTGDERERESQQKQQAQAKAQGFDTSGDYIIGYTCPSCGAEVMTTASTAATTCYYCQNPIVLGSRLSGEFLPDRVVPFALSRESAIERFKKSCGKRMFLPKGFSSEAQFDKFQGVYFPYWYLDEHKQASMVAKGEKVRTWSSGNRDYTETSTYRLYRTGEMHIRNVAEKAIDISKQDKTVMQQREIIKDPRALQCVHPFDLSQAKPFAMSYLSGFQAEKRDIEKTAIAGMMEKRMQDYAKQLLEGTMSEYSGLSVEVYNDKNFSEKWSYTLLPVWITTYEYKGEIIPFAINGQTGKTYGKLPVAMGKVLAAAGIIAVVIFLLGLLGGALFA